MIKILHIIEALGDFGGTPRKLLYLSELQEQHNIQNYFYCYLPSAISNIFEEQGCEVFNAKTMRMDKQLFSLVKYVNKIKPDVICTHFTRPLFLGFFAAKFLNIPLVHSEHCSPDYRKGITGEVSKFTLKSAKKIICNSAFTQIRFDKKYPKSSRKSLVVYNPVKQREETKKEDLRLKHNIDDKALVIGHVGGLVPWRDQLTLLKSFDQLTQCSTLSHLVLVGDGPCRPEIEKYIAENKLENSVTLAGYSDNIGGYLKLFDIFVNPAIEEGFGIAVVEAMLSSLPVVLANAGAHPELVKESETGFLYEKKNENDLFQKLSMLSQSPELRIKVGNQAKISANQTFSLENYASNYYGAIKNILPNDEKSQSTNIPFPNN